jgi:hypothetical protein
LMTGKLIPFATRKEKGPGLEAADTANEPMMGPGGKSDGVRQTPS